MGLRSSLGKAVSAGWTVFNHELSTGFAEYQINAAAAAAQRRSKHIDSLITGDYARSTSSGRKITFS
jgi:hypothetical protein